jgi:spore germination protein GerM
MISGDYWLKLQPVADAARWLEQAQAKVDIVQKLFSGLYIQPKTLLFTHFNPIVLLLEKTYTCTVIGEQALKYAYQSSSTFVDDITQVQSPVDVTIALDEYFTYAETENEQRNLLTDIKSVTRGYLITSLQDYKNNAPHKRNHVESGVYNDTIVVEQSQTDKNKKQNWINHIYFIENNRDLTIVGPVNRRTMYFKQLAKYSSDLNGTDYVIQKNLLYRGFFKRNYEHIITMRFI